MVPNTLLRSTNRLLNIPLHKKISNKWNLNIFKNFSTQTKSDTRGNNNNINNIKHDKKETYNNADTKVRLNKLISLNSHYSRREATKLITERKVTIAGKVTRIPHECYSIKDLTNAVKVNGKLLPMLQHSSDTKNSKVWIAHKLKGEIVTHNDPNEKPSLIDRLIKGGMKKQGNFKAIGRLDMNTEGLILFTTNGMYKQAMELPINQIHRRYRVRVHGNVTDEKLKAMRRGVEYEGLQYKGVRVESSKEKGGGRMSANTWLTITCVEGKNRLVRNMCKCLGRKLLFFDFTNFTTRLNTTHIFHAPLHV